MNKICSICGRKVENDAYCETCTIIIAAVYHKYNIQQIMAMFSHIIGAKITQEITNTMYTTLKDSCESETLKNEGKLN